MKIFILRAFFFCFTKERRASLYKKVLSEISQGLPASGMGHFDNAVEYIDAAFVVYDPEGKLVACNKHFRNMYQYSEDEARAGVHFKELGVLDVERGNVATGDELGDDYLDRKVAYRKNPRGTFTVKLADGRWIMTRDRRTDDGSLVSIQTDISDIKNTEDALLLAKEEAELANRVKSEFLANMSHELRTPLNSIIGFSSLLESQIESSGGSASLKEYAADINESGAYLLKVINEILDVAKVEAGQLELNEDKLDITSVIQSCVNMVSVRAATNNIKLSMNIQSQLPILFGDETRIKQIVTNLLSNAVKFTDPGGEIIVQALQSDDGALALTVSDDGIGMSEDDISVALTKFGQVNSSYARNHDGTGLGLNLVYSLVRAHGGELAVFSELDVGTKVSVHFPPERSIIS